MNRHKIFYIDKVKEINYFDEKMLMFRGGEYEVPYPIQESKGEWSLKNSEYCKKHHKLLVDEITEEFRKFPFCCEYHSDLVNLKEFDKNDFIDIPKITADKIMFSYTHIINNVEDLDWYKDITDYIDYAVESYGSFPPGYGGAFELHNYFNCLFHLLKINRKHLRSDTISKIELNKRLNKIMNYLEIQLKPKTQNEYETDLNLLVSTYEKWVKIFPFDLTYFSHLKEKFKKTLLVVKGKPNTNKYKGVSTVKMHTKDSLLISLVEITRHIISNINAATLFEKGQLDDIEKIELDLVLKNRKLELDQLETMTNKSKQDYIKVLKKWFKSEKKFINEIKPFLDKKKSTATNKNRPNRTDIAYFCFYTSEAKELQTQNIFPSKKAWKEIAEIFGRDDTNIQKAYNKIYGDKKERLKISKKLNIKYVLENMLNDYPNAKKEAQKELNIPTLN